MLAGGEQKLASAASAQYNTTTRPTRGGFWDRVGTERGQGLASLTQEQFLQHLRDCLNHLHDPGRLRSSPLAALFGVAGRADTPTALRRILTEAIEALEPDPREPADSRAWRMYEAMYYRYVEQYEQEEVASQLGMSVRQVRREQRAAPETLMYRLWERFGLASTASRPTGDTQATAAVVAAGQQSLDLDQELAWLQEAPPERPADLGQVLADVLRLVQPLAQRYRVCLDVAPAASLPAVAADPVVLRQILLNLLSVAIPAAASREQLQVRATPLLWSVEICIACQDGPVEAKAIPPEGDSRLGMALQLAALCGGSLKVAPAAEPFAARLTLPALEQLPVLAIDDNPGTLQLLQRYTAGTRYRLIGTRDPEQALALAQKVSPQLIVLDVMMPRVDGWEILGRLREHPLTSGIPIVVCTILAQEELALALGASGFLQKPLTRQAFLATLDRLAVSVAIGSR